MSENDEDAVLMDSLPSHSTFIAHEREERSILEQRRAVEQHGQMSRDFQRIEEENSPQRQRESFADEISSPTPPPPPPSSNPDAITPDTWKSSPGTQKPPLSAGSVGSNGTPKPKPFLRKGSRKEPSAMHRINRDGPSPITAQADSPRDESVGSRGNGASASASSVRAYKNQIDRRSSGNSPVEMNATSRGGFQYSELTDDDVKRPQASRGRMEDSHSSSVSLQKQANGGIDMDLSGTFDTDWSSLNRRRVSGEKELSEFEEIERTLAVGQPSDPFAFNVSGSYAASQQPTNFSSSLNPHEPLRPKADPIPTRANDSPVGHSLFNSSNQPVSASPVDRGGAQTSAAASGSSDNQVDLSVALGIADVPSTSYGGASAEVSADEVLRKFNSGGYSVAAGSTGAFSGRANQNSEETNDNISWGSVGNPSPINDSMHSAADTAARPKNFGSPGIRRVDPNRRSEDMDLRGSPSYGKTHNDNHHHQQQQQQQQQQQHQQQQQPRVRSNSPFGNRSSGIRTSSQGVKGVHHEGKAMSNLMDNTHQGSILNRPPATRPRTSNTRTPSPANRGASSSSGSGLESGGDRSKTANGSNGAEAQQIPPNIHRELSAKALALENELKEYKTNNAQLRSLRKQAEASHAEAVQQRAETVKWATKHREQVEAECEELRAAALKDRRLAAKHARDARSEGASASVRNLKAERESYESTIKDLQDNIETLNKKAKMTERRLQGVIREHTKNNETLTIALEKKQSDMQSLLTYLDKSGIRVPAALRTGASPIKTPSKNDTARNSGGHSANMSIGTGTLSFATKDATYVQTLDIDEGDGDVANSDSWDGNNEHNMDAGNLYNMSAKSDTFADPSRKEKDVPLVNERDGPRGALSDALFRTSANPIRSSTNNRPAYSPEKYGGSAQSGNISLTKTISPQSSHDNFPKMQAYANEVNNNEHPSGASLGLGNGLGDSWQRSSRGSRGSGGNSSRYSREDWEEDEDDYLNKQNAEGEESKSNAHQSLDMRHHTVQSDSSKARTASNSFGATTSSNTAGRKEETLADGRRIVRYRNGTVKEMRPDGEILVRFLNGDTKWTSRDGYKVVYYYAEARTRHTTYKDGVDVYEFPNSQIERHHPDGTKEVSWPDGTVKVIQPDGKQTTTFPDSVMVTEFPDGTREVSDPAGQASG